MSAKKRISPPPHPLIMIRDELIDTLGCSEEQARKAAHAVMARFRVQGVEIIAASWADTPKIVKVHHDTP